ncbi:MAG: MarR family winged helix-turn-helix transcriptional regulator [Candidatus Puniceispirillales bacterium]
MADVKSLNNPLILREEALRYSIELLFFAYRDFTAEADAILARRDLGRAHHRVIYFVGREPGITITALLSILNITKQSLSRVLNKLVDDGYVELRQGKDDKRQRLLSLTPKGCDLEAELTEVQKHRFSKAYKAAGFTSADGFLAVMQEMLDPQTREMLKKHPHRTPPR